MGLVVVIYAIYLRHCINVHRITVWNRFVYFSYPFAGDVRRTNNNIKRFVINLSLGVAVLIGIESCTSDLGFACAAFCLVLPATSVMDAVICSIALACSVEPCANASLALATWEELVVT